MILRVPGAAGRQGGGKEIAVFVAATWLWVVAAGVFISIAAPATSAQAMEFRGMEWGMSEEEVARKEAGLPLPLTWKGLHYLITVGTVPARVQYQFEDGKLHAASISYLRKRATSLEFIREYEVVNNSLNDRFGIPVRDGKVWLDRLYEHKPEEWGFAVSIGQLKYFARWETPQSYISHILYGRAYKINHSVLIESRAWKDAAGKAIKTQGGKQ